jgi:hypothetical protein
MHVTRATHFRSPTPTQSPRDSRAVRSSSYMMSLLRSEKSASPPVHLLHARVGGESTGEGHESDMCVTAFFDKYTVSVHISYSQTPGTECSHSAINTLIGNRNCRTRLSPSSSRTTTTSYSISTLIPMADATSSLSRYCGIKILISSLAYSSTVRFATSRTLCPSLFGRAQR